MCSSGGLHRPAPAGLTLQEPNRLYSHTPAARGAGAWHTVVQGVQGDRGIGLHRENQELCTEVLPILLSVNIVRLKCSHNGSDK